MGRVLLSILLGLFAPAVFIGAAELLGGKNPILENVAGSLAVALYLAICQFLVAPRGSRGLGAKWPTMVAMGGALLAVFLLIGAAEGKRVATGAAPMLISGCLGILAGAAVAGRVTISAMSLGSCRRYLRTCAALMVGMALVVAAGVVPLSRADTFPTATPEKAVPLFWGIAVLNVLVAVSLLSIAGRAGHGRRPSAIVLDFLAFLAFVAAFLLAPTAVFLTHGPAMAIAGILGVLCSVTEFVVTAVVGSTALRLPGT